MKIAPQIGCLIGELYLKLEKDQSILMEAIHIIFYSVYIYIHHIFIIIFI